MTFPGDSGQPATLPGPWTFWVDQSVAPYTPFGQLILSGFTCTSLLSDYGAGQAIIPVATSPMTRPNLLAFWTWRLWALYNGRPVWAGCPTGLVDEGGTSVTVSLTELPGYLARKQYATSRNYSQVEQTSIAADLAANLANIGVSVVTQAGSGVKRDRLYGYLEDTSRGDLLTSLMQVNNGAQFRAEYALDPSTALPGCTLRIAYPRVGLAGNASGLALVVPGGAASFQATWSSDMMRTRTFAVGDVPQVNTPPFPASGHLVTSGYSEAVVAVISGGTWGGSGNVTVNGSTAGTGPGSYTIPPLGSITLTYSGTGSNAPTWNWNAASQEHPVQTDIRPQAGVPPLDSADDWPGVSWVPTLTERAATNATIYAGPTLALTAVMPVGDPLLGTYGVGDDVSVVLADPLLPAGLATTGQLTEIDIDAAAGTVTWTVAITAPPPRLTTRLSVRLAATDARLRAGFHNNIVSPPTGIET